MYLSKKGCTAHLSSGAVTFHTNDEAFYNSMCYFAECGLSYVNSLNGVLSETL